jgi:hypothetical protein
MIERAHCLGDHQAHWHDVLWSLPPHLVASHHSSFSLVHFVHTTIPFAQAR